MPAIVGIPWLATWLGGLFTGLVTWMGGFLTKRLAIAAATITAILSLTAAFILAIEATVAGLAQPFPAVGGWWGLIAPSNASSILGATITARLIAWAYVWNVKIFQYRLF